MSKQHSRLNGILKWHTLIFTTCAWTLDEVWCSFSSPRISTREWKFKKHEVNSLCHCWDHFILKQLDIFFKIAACLIFLCSFSLSLSLQFLHRAQMQTPRPALSTNTPSLRPGSQTPTAAAVYPPNQTIMMTMTPMPFPSAQTAQYYIPQVPEPLPNLSTACMLSTAIEPSLSHLLYLIHCTHCFKCNLK